MEIKTNFAVFAVSVISAYLIGRYTGFVREKINKHKEKIEELENFLKHM